MTNEPRGRKFTSQFGQRRHVLRSLGNGADGGKPPAGSASSNDVCYQVLNQRGEKESNRFARMKHNKNHDHGRSAGLQLVVAGQ